MEESFPFPRPPWSQRCAQGYTSNVVQTLFNRELGFPGFSRSTDTMSNFKNVTLIGRQLVYQRCPALSETPMMPHQIKLGNGNKDKKSSKVTGKRRSPPTWLKFAAEHMEKISLNAGYFRKTRILNNDNEDYVYLKEAIYSNTFYKLEDDSQMGVKSFSCTDSLGFQEATELFNFRSAEAIPMSTNLVTLNEMGHVQIFDLSRVSQLKSPRTIYLPLPPFEHNLRCTDMTLDADNGNLIVTATKDGKAKYLYRIKCPSFSVEGFLCGDGSYKLQVFGSCALIMTPQRIQFADVNDLFRVSCNGVGPGGVHTPHVQPRIYKGVQSTNSYLGVMEVVWPPVYFCMSPGLIIKIISMDEDQDLWSTQITMSCDVFMEPLRDRSPSMLFKLNDTHSIISLEKATDDPPTYTVKVDSSHNLLFSSLEKKPIRRPTTRPKRDCVLRREIMDSQMEKRDRVIEMDYSDDLDLLGVCILEDNVIIISLYEGRTHKLFKRLPGVQLQSTRRRGRRRNGDNPRFVAEESKIDFIITTDIIFLTIQDLEYNTQYLCLKLLEEDTSSDD